MMMHYNKLTRFKIGDHHKCIYFQHPSPKLTDLTNLISDLSHSDMHADWGEILGRSALSKALSKLIRLNIRFSRIFVIAD